MSHAVKRAVLEGVEIPEQNIDFILGFAGGGVQVGCTFKDENEPPIVDRLKRLEHKIIEAVLHTPEGNAFSGIYTVNEVRIQRLTAFDPPIWKVILLLKRM